MNAYSHPEVEEITPLTPPRALLKCGVRTLALYSEAYRRYARKFLEFREVTLYLGNFIVCSQHSKTEAKHYFQLSDVS